MWSLGIGLSDSAAKARSIVWPALLSKIDREAGKDGVHRLDPSEAPAPVHAKTAVGQLHQGFDVVPLQLARRRHFLEFFSHKVS